MAVSVRQTATQCLGLSGAVSVSRGIFGYEFGPPSRPIRLKVQLELAKGDALNLSLLRVGPITPEQRHRMTFAVQRTRELFAQQGVGIRKLYWLHVPDDRYVIISDRNEAECLTEDWNGDNDGIDVFFVQEIEDSGGWSSSGRGPCDKDEKGMSGAVLELSGSDEFTGVLLAHEVGHYLGLRHGAGDTNLMGRDSNGDGIAELGLGNTGLTDAQGSTMKGHCSVKNPC